MQATSLSEAALYSRFYNLVKREASFGACRLMRDLFIRAAVSVSLAYMDGVFFTRTLRMQSAGQSGVER